ncbi:cytochrome aa3 quinol oxidase subunit III [Virgibacillus phasianinus]|uniref:Cytochrome aa3 quinol oxidase subunit III n=1 Tax=Virgibacillus phasianinus TaxID=2017483 RepID=A0A220U1K5_9BACI|nr:cytochrome c oxidase subunit 3 [Virgibacillus phasianinus]ASK62028.1 cytochrome aa3 quinol oxidase subunit III [Virgibacillus phasianinus]
MNNYQEALFRDKRLGFFIYLFVESVMFGTLFATYLIFTPPPTYPKPHELFEVKSLVLSSVFLLSSSGTLMIAEKGLDKRQGTKIVIGLVITLLFGLTFLGLELHEFYKYVMEDNGLTANVFMSSFYVLVGLHASHVTFGACWMILLLIQYKRMNMPYGLYIEKQRIFQYYWHFVDVIWVFIIIIVYLPYLL